MQQAIQIEIPAIEFPLSLRYRLCKRIFDFAGAIVLLCFLAPILLACAILVRRSSSGPILFRQARFGAQGREFNFLKFRSMYENADQSIHQQYVGEFIRGRAELHQHDQRPMYKLIEDTRITPIGRKLRRTSLDELPQLWNVIRGEMSLVGPRPPIKYELEHYRADQFQRLAVKPGMTGLWQVNGRSETTFDEMVAFDLEYIKSASLLTDFRILIKTIPVVFSKQGA